jgi:crotonobetainyl-CoA:carnitine CoA-transferase CaiB-like acyl-CoA transferase
VTAGVSSLSTLIDRPLADLRVIDAAAGSLSAIGRLLGELGAEVIRIEPAAGGRDRTEGLCMAGVSLGFATANTSKHAVAFDFDDADQRQRLEALIGTADILIDPGTLIAASTLHSRHARLIILTATAFGATGTYAAWQATDAVLQALSGELSRSGIPGRAPLLPPGELAIACACVQAVFAILLACVNRLANGLGDHLDFSLLEAASQALDPGYGIAGSASLGVAAKDLPPGRVEARHQYPIIPCRDGHVRLCVLSPRQWQAMFAWLGKPAAFADDSFNALHVRFASTTLVPAIAAFFADRTRADLEAEGQHYGVPTAALLSLDEALETAQITARQALRSMDIAPGVRARVPDGVIEIDGERMGVRGPAPAAGEHQAMLDGMLARDMCSASPAAPQGGRPLAGLRVLDLGVIVVGAEQGRLLADQGADVIKVESTAFPDGSRQSRDGGPMAPTFAAGHFNKRSLGINLRDPEGLALLRRLAADSDIILSNFKPGTLVSLGLDAASLRALNPRLILVDSSAFGPTGPWRARLGYGPLVRASSGLTAQWRYDDDPAGFSDAMTVYPDHVAARIGAIGALALLLRRARTGAGGTASVAQNEVMLGHMAERIAAASLHAAEPPRDAPWGVFACAGDDQWCVVTVRDDTDWQRLCVVIDRGDLATDPALAARSGRQAARHRIDAALGEWLSQRSPIEAMTLLQDHSVPAGAMLRVAELPEFGFFAERGAYRLVSHPFLPAPFHREAMPVHSLHLGTPADGPAPLLGEHSIEIARERLGLSEAEITRLLAAGILQVPAPPERQKVTA